MESENFLLGSKLPWKDLGGGLSRQIIGYDEQIMLVKVQFKKGAVGVLHQHLNTQSSLIASGSFEVEINGEKKILNTGDGFYVEPNVMHGVVCLEEGMILDAFSPSRQDFL